MKYKNQLPYGLIIFLLSGLPSKVMACEACKKQQPKFLQDITHGRGPDSSWDYLIVSIMVLITLYVLIRTLQYLIKPAETSEQHIKRMILNE